MVNPTTAMGVEHPTMWTKSNKKLKNVLRYMLTSYRYNAILPQTNSTWVNLIFWWSEITH